MVLPKIHLPDDVGMVVRPRPCFVVEELGPLESETGVGPPELATVLLAAISCCI